MADFSVMMVAVDLEPQQIGRTDRLSDQLSQCLIYRYQPSDVRVWRRPEQQADLAFPIACHTGPQPEVIVWGAISFDSRTPLDVIRGTLTPQRYVDDILRTALLPLLWQYPKLIFQQDNTRPLMARACCYELSYNLSNTSLASQRARSLSN
ncbi:transposable element Tc1 transposase [Trichonephila clavipes]|nr:transposable element Tc1 transposase [Trichonephila clavipes]